jgi:uncharacterized protein (TIGR02996 family)
MTGDDAFLWAIIESPDDNTLRLVYADWLEEHGQPDRAAFIRIQCELTRLADGNPRRPELEAVERRLLKEHGDEWLAQAWPQACTADVRFGRGFVQEVSLRGAGLGDADVATLARSPWLGLLTGLDLGSNDVGDAGVRALAQSPYLANLTFLDLRENPFGDEAASALGRFARLLRLDTLWCQAPVQADGAVGPHPFYFRARFRQWSFAVSEDPSVDASDVYHTSERGFALECRYGDSPFAASYIPHQEAITIIRRCAEEYRKTRGMR